MLHYFKIHYTNSQRKGIIGLLLFCLVIQGVIFGWSYFQSDDIQGNKSYSYEWKSVEKSIDSLKKVKSTKSSNKVFPFNPNFIDDFKGYQLGMSSQEIDKLLEFRKKNQFIQSASEFQKVTGISDSLLAVLAPNLKFRDWNKNAKQNYTKKSPKAKDINLVTAKDLMEIPGIGPVISAKIIKIRDDMGGFLSTEQYQYIWGITPEVQQSMLKYCYIKDISKVKKYKINELSMKELAIIPYYNYALAKETITYRSMHNGIKNIEDLTKIKGFPVEKLNIIVLYLEF